MREGSYGLECLLCRTGTKEHESILHTLADAELIHAGLLATGAKSGHPVQYREENGKYFTVPPSGSNIEVLLEFTRDGKTMIVPAQSWVRNDKTHKEMTEKWVFAGSQLWDGSDDKKKKVYAATPEGAYICTSNVPTALLDVPISSPRSIESRSFEAFTERIPPEETPVMVILEPVSLPK